MGGQAHRAGTDQELTGLVRELMLVTRHSVLEVADSYRDDDRLDRSAFILLSRLEAEGSMSMRQLADAFGLDVSTVNRQTAAMLRIGVAERIPDPAGGLARMIRITGEGRKRLRKERDWSVNGLRHVLQNWAPEEISQLLTALTRFNQSIEELSGKPWPRTADSIPQENQDEFGTRPDSTLRLPATKALSGPRR
jgi:DNA-binding MarR family transcriptional regulator